MLKPIGMEVLNGYDVFSLWTFLTLSYSELNFLAFSQSFEAISSNVAEMSENVRAIFLLDEAEAFSFVEPFNGASRSRHRYILFI